MTTRTTESSAPNTWAANGYEILQAKNGADAIDTAIRRTPDLAIMDLDMPVMDRLEAIQRLKSDAHTCDVPVVVLSGNGIVDHAKAKEAGCDACLVKPCDLDNLVVSSVR
jgi:two-component system, cell cycle response regulator DivK